MNIIAAAPSTTIVRPATTPAPKAGAEVLQQPEDTFRSSVTRAAYAGCGALGGLALGAVSGQVMSHLTSNPVFSSLGGGVGAVGGAATSLALALSDQPVHMGRVFGSWAGSSAGATGGMYLMRELGSYLAGQGAAAYFGSHGALIGAAGVGLAGGGLAFAGDRSKVGKIARSAAKAGAGITVGLALGGAAQAALATCAPALTSLGVTAPAVLAGTLGLVGVQNEINRGWVDGYEYKPSVETLDLAAKTVVGGAAGYLAGSLLAGFAVTAGGSPVYLAAAPALGGAIGLAGSFGSVRSNERLTGLALAAGVAGGSAMVGDLLGHGLSALTGLPAFKMLGPATGAVAGASFELDRQGRLPKYIAPAAIGFAAGSTAGTLLGAGLTALTGHSAYQIAGSAIGSVAGVLAGLAGRAHADQGGSRQAPKAGAAKQAV